MLTRKHYIKMAEIVNKIEDLDTKIGVYLDVLAYIEEDGNPNFDRNRFRAACGFNVDAVFREPDAEEMRIHNAEVAAASDP
tara:strand:- start:1077 stop:1319 length:243 start_codon:yes stop_codon:yes gene_type:complete